MLRETKCSTFFMQNFHKTLKSSSNTATFLQMPLTVVSAMSVELIDLLSSITVDITDRNA